MSESILDLTGADMESVYQETVQPAGTEAKLRIVSVISGTDKNNINYVMPFFEVMDDPYCKEFGDYMPLPSPGDMSEKELNKSKLRLNAFGAAFEIDFSVPQDTDEWVGNEGWAILGVGKDQDGEPVNKINKYVGSA